VSRYRCVDAQKAAGFPVAAACAAAGVSTSAYYAWAASRDQRPSHAELEETQVLAEIRTVHAGSDGTYGSPRVTAELRRRGWHVNHKRVERLMAAHGIIGHRPSAGSAWPAGWPFTGGAGDRGTGGRRAAWVPGGSASGSSASPDRAPALLDTFEILNLPHTSRREVLRNAHCGTPTRAR
jgi:hypothetical protein